MMRSGFVCGAALVLAASGCAARVASPELVAAREAIVAARTSPSAGKALDELREAEDALDRLEQIASFAPPEELAAEAYVARRKAERAQIAGQYGADVEALARARESVVRLRQNLERRDVQRRDATHRAVVEERDRKQGFEVFQADVDRARDNAGELHREAEGPVLELPAKFLFKPGLTELSEHGARRLEAVLDAVHAAPLLKVVVRVVDSSGGIGATAALLAKRRAAKLRDAFVERGVPADLVLAEGQEGKERHVRIAFIEQHAVPALGAPAAVVSPPAAEPSPPGGGRDATRR
jgi:outer membrane protein OmpA-like peptidoglycan-associated protein